MSKTKKILVSILIVLVVIQFIQPAHNKSDLLLPTDISKIYNVPDSVQRVLKSACFDCHSNNTNYPWYANIQPVAWFMARHVENGKADLNFSEFGTYTIRKQKSKLQSIANTIHDDEMPLSSYRLMHKKANLTQNEKALLISWATKTKDSLSTKN